MKILKTAPKHLHPPLPLQPHFAHSPLHPLFQPYWPPFCSYPTDCSLLWNTRAYLYQAPFCSLLQWQSHQEVFLESESPVTYNRPTDATRSIQSFLHDFFFHFCYGEFQIHVKVDRTGTVPCTHQPRPVLTQPHAHYPLFIELWSKFQMAYHFIGKEVYVSHKFFSFLK